MNCDVMLKSILPKIKIITLSTLVLTYVSLNYSFVSGLDEQELLSWSNKCLSQSYDPSNEVKLKKWELTLTGDSFLRLRKTYQNGKKEYYSLQLHFFNDLDYLGTSNTGTLKLKTSKDDIIVQTHGDPKGDVDSMATSLNIPVKNMGPERLDSLPNALLYFKSKNL
jgi:hypothetical protein